MLRFSAPQLFAFSLLGLALGACQAIAGIEERTFDPALAAPEDTKQCKDYCTRVLANCTGTNAVYNDEETCLGFCRYLEPGDSSEPEPNTVACRLQQAEFAEREPDDHCSAAGPGGNDVCGSDCEAYCDVYPQVCPDTYVYPDKATCLKACKGLPDQSSFDVKRDHDGDTVECRLVHTASSTTLPLQHCQHAPIPPAEPWCTSPADEAPSCEAYCLIELSVCDGERTQYESPEQCLAVCKALDPGVNSDQAGNTVGCRRYHSFSASLGENALHHCFHSGPTGDGHCGKDDAETGITANCESYCKLLEAACPDEFATTMTSNAQCLDSCKDLKEAKFDSFYAVSTAPKSTGLNCRVLYTARAFEDKTACASALGGDQCK
jgi:hypothetical protein